MKGKYKFLFTTMLILLMISGSAIFVAASDLGDFPHPEYEFIYESGYYTYAVKEYAGEKCAVILDVSDPNNLVEIPDTLDGYPVRKLESNIFEGLEIFRLVLPEGLKVIDEDAFKNCDLYKKEVSIPSSVEEIHSKAFGTRGEEGCTLDKVVLVTDLGSYAYEYAVQNGMSYNLNTYSEYASEDGTVNIRVEDASILEEGMNLKVNIITEGEEYEALTKDISEEAVLYDISFVKDENVISLDGNMRIYLEWPQEINKTYGSIYKVNEDGSLTEVEEFHSEDRKDWILETEVGKYLFVNGHVNGDSANDFVIEDGVLKQYLCFDKVVVIPEGVTEIADGAFLTSYAEIIEVVLPESLQRIGKDAFNGISSLTKINVAEDVEVGDRAFRGCVGLCDENGMIIVNGVLYDARNMEYVELDELVIPDGVNTISTYAFEEMGSIYKIVLPDSIRSIRPSAFAFCSGLKEIVLPEGLEFIGKNAFAETAVTSITIPDSVTTIEEGTFSRAGKNENAQLVIYGKSLSPAEVEASNQGYTFIPTNDQIRGDVNGNGIYEAEDALGILKMVVKLETMYGYSADANEDGEVAADDAFKVLRKVVALE